MRLLAGLCAALWFSLAAAAAPVTATPLLEEFGVTQAQLAPGYWLARLAEPNAERLAPAEIAALNDALLERDRNTFDLARVQATLDRTRVSAWIAPLVRVASRPLFDETGKRIAAARVAGWMLNARLDAIPARTTTRHGLVVRRADLRALPTRDRAFNTPGDADLDRLQETAFFPGTPVIIAYESRDKAWWFVVGPRYAAWIEKNAVAEASAAEVLAYARRAPALDCTIRQAAAHVIGVLDHPGPAVDLADDHHGVPRHVDDVAGLGRAQCGEPARRVVAFAEAQDVQRRARGLGTRVARQLEAEGAIDLGDEAAAVAGAAGVAPSVAFAHELEGLRQHVRAAEGQVAVAYVCTARQQCGCESQIPVWAARGQFDGVLVDGRLFACWWYANTHVQQHARVLRGLVCKRRANRGTRHHERRRANGVVVTPLEPLLVDDGRTVIEAMVSILRVRR